MHWSCKNFRGLTAHLPFHQARFVRALFYASANILVWLNLSLRCWQMSPKVQICLPELLLVQVPLLLPLVFDLHLILQRRGRYITLSQSSEYSDGNSDFRREFT